MSDLIYKDESFKIVGACFEVYKEKGCGYNEAIYHECLEIEFRLQQIPAISKPEVQMEYKGHVLGQSFEPDYVCYGKIVIELKAELEITDRHRAQALKYLKATGYQLALLINFGHHPKIQIERIVNTTGRIAPNPSIEPPDLHA
jgi:GxxExxY protein